MSDPDDTAARLAGAARDDSVTTALLTGDDGPALLDLLAPGERPHYVLRGAVVEVVDEPSTAGDGDGPGPRQGQGQGPPARDAGRSRKLPDRGFDALTVVTDRRVLVVVPRADADADRLDLAYDETEAVRLQRAAGNRRLVVDGPDRGLRADVAGAAVETCRAAAAYARERAGDAADAGTVDDAAAAGSGPDPLSAIERLADLRERGAITEAEFEAKKRELLDRL